LHFKDICRYNQRNQLFPVNSSMTSRLKDGPVVPNNGRLIIAARFLLFESKVKGSYKGPLGKNSNVKRLNGLFFKKLGS